MKSKTSLKAIFKQLVKGDGQRSWPYIKNGKLSKPKKKHYNHVFSWPPGLLIVNLNVKPLQRIIGQNARLFLSISTISWRISY